MLDAPVAASGYELVGLNLFVLVSGTQLRIYIDSQMVSM